MATTITPQRIDRTGIDRTATTQAAAEMIVSGNDGNVWIEIEADVACDVSFIPAITFGGFGLSPETLHCAASSRLVAGPFPPAVFGSSVTLTVSGSDLTRVRIAAFGI